MRYDIKIYHAVDITPTIVILYNGVYYPFMCRKNIIETIEHFMDNLDVYDGVTTFSGSYYNNEELTEITEERLRLLEL
jgi:hypothetical protein